MYQTIQVSSCVSVQGDLVELLPNGDVIIRDGMHVYRGRPIVPIATPASPFASQRAIPVSRDQD
jgi:hypothetical protein